MPVEAPVLDVEHSVDDLGRHLGEGHGRAVLLGVQGGHEPAVAVIHEGAQRQLIELDHGVARAEPHRPRQGAGGRNHEQHPGSQADAGQDADAKEAD